MRNFNQGVFSQLLGDLSKEEFLAQYWEEKWLHIPRTENQNFDGLLSVKDLEFLLLGAKSDSLDIVAVGQPIDAPSSSSENSNELPSPIDQWYLGRTLVFNQLDKKIPAVSAFTRALEHELSCRIQCNAYLTPPNAKGFSLHYDTHEIFVLQVFGSKNWTIGSREIDSPLKWMDYDPATIVLGGSPAKLSLVQGDVLYLPRGFPHFAETGPRISCHITVGIYRDTYFDVLEAAIILAANRVPQLRKSLPLGCLGDSLRNNQIVRASDLLSQVTAEDICAAIKALREKFIGECRRSTTDTILAMEKIDLLTASDVQFQSAANLNLEITVMGSELQLLALGKSISFPNWVQEPLEFCSTAKRFRLEDIPGDLDIAEKEVLVRRLITEGIVQICMPDC